VLYRRFSLGDADNQGTANALPNEPSGGEDGPRLEGIERPSDPRTATVGDVTFRVGSRDRPERSVCGLFHVRYWHLTDIGLCTEDVRFRG
jgi:hypothetical protein